MRAANLKLILLSVFFALLAGCATLKGVPDSYFHPQADLAAIKKVAILPFENLTNDRFAGEKAANCFLVQVLEVGVFQVVEPGEVERVLNELLPGRRREETGKFDVGTIKKLGEELNVQAVILGAVNQYELAKSKAGSYPQVGLTVRLVDVETGTIIWMVSHSLKGGPRFPIVSTGEIFTLPKLTKKLCRQIVESIVR